MQYHDMDELCTALVEKLIDNDLINIHDFGSLEDARQAAVHETTTFLQDFTIIPGIPIQPLCQDTVKNRETLQGAGSPPQETAIHRPVRRGR